MHANASYFRLITKIIPGVAAAGGNTGTDFTFDDQPDIRYARMTGLVFFTDQELSVAQPQTTPLVSAAFTNLISFVFETNDPDDLPKKDGAPGEKLKGNDGRFTGTLDTIQWIPAAMLRVNQSFGVSQPSFVRQMIHWKDRYVIWQKSHIKLSTGGLGNQTDVAICLGAFYTFTNSMGKVIYPRN